MTHNPYEKILTLLARIPRPPEAEPVIGATAEQVRALERRLHEKLPSTLREWLGFCNGVVAGPGNLLGAVTASPELDIAYAQSLWLEWHEHGWLPVATDGTGNAYVMKAASSDRSEAVYFVDCSEDPGALAYVVASALPMFLIFLLEKELGESRWPFDEPYVTGRDPSMIAVSDAPAPWSA